MSNIDRTFASASDAMTEMALNLPPLHAGWWRDSADDLAHLIQQAGDRLTDSEAMILMFVGGMMKRQMAVEAGEVETAAELLARIKMERVR